MSRLPQALQNLITRLSRLPGVGKRSAERMAFALLSGNPDETQALASALHQLSDEVGTCDQCGYFTDRGICPICTSPGRDDAVLCVVEDSLDVVAFEKAGGYRGLYHVLGGVLSPLKGVTAADLRMTELTERIRKLSVKELILATSPSVEGDATALYIMRTVSSPELRITRIGRGVPMGGSLELADSGTLRMAMESRRGMDP